MKLLKIALNVLAVVLMLAPSTLFAQPAESVKIGQLEELIRNSKGPLVVNFWATWCGPCLEEMPYLQQAVYGNDSTRAELILVSLDSKSVFDTKLNAFLEQKKWKGKMLWLNETDADYFCPRIDSSWSGAIPATLFVNNTKNLKRFVEQELSGEEARRMIEEL